MLRLDQFGAVFKMHGVVMKPASAPNEAMLLEDFDNLRRACRFDKERAERGASVSKVRAATRFIVARAILVTGANLALIHTLENLKTFAVRHF